MILVWGSPNDPPVARVLEMLESRSTPALVIDGRSLATLRYDFTFGATTSGWLEPAGRRIAVDQIRGAYIRPFEPSAGPARATAIALLALAANLRVVVVNRPAAGASNNAKPYQLGLIAEAGFDVPETLVTTDPSAARAFLREQRRVVYKSLSGIRSVVAMLDERDDTRIDDVRSGPVQFQAYVPGLDVRVHVVGDRWFACAVRSTATDYRYAHAAGASVDLEPFELPEDVGLKLVSMVRGMDLLLAGVDLRLTPEGTWVCFEVNPSPGFTWYEEATEQPIAEAIVMLLES